MMKNYILLYAFFVSFESVFIYRQTKKDYGTGLT